MICIPHLMSMKTTTAFGLSLMRKSCLSKGLGFLGLIYL